MTRIGAKLVWVDLAAPLQPLEVEPRYSEVLITVALRGDIVGSFFLKAMPRIPADELMLEISGRLGPRIARSEMRQALIDRTRSQSPSSSTATVSVIICTRDRPDELEACLASLRRLRTGPLEVIVVDNGSRDQGTREVCERSGVTYVPEPQAGQSRARNRGIAAASGELVAFTDDDCEVDPAWLDDLGASFADPLAMAVTGYIGARTLDSHAQHLFELHGGFEGHDHRRVFDTSAASPIAGARVAGAGANMVFRREAFSIIGGFAEDLGPGTPARSSDDKYCFFRLLAAGYRIVFEPQRVVWHTHRSEMEDLWRIFRDYGTAEVAYTLRVLVRDGDPEGLRVWAWWAKHVLREFARGPGKSKVPRRVPAEEGLGLLAGGPAWLRSVRSRERIPAVDPWVSRGPSGEQSRADAGFSVVSPEAPKATIAIASRNRRDSLRAVLEHLARQRSSGDFEVVVVLDGTSDDSAQMVRGLDLPFERRAIERDWAGLAATRNAGAEAATNPLVIFLDDDVLPEPGFVAAHANAHAGQGERVVLGAYPPGDLGDDYWARHLRIWWSDHFARKSRSDHRWTYVDFLDGNCSIGRDLFLELGQFFEGFRGGRRQDWDFGFRLLRGGTELIYEPRASGTHHIAASFDLALRNARQEGRLDITLCERHPQLLGHLPIARVGPLLVSGSSRFLHSVRALMRPSGQRALLLAMNRAERLGLDAAWRRLMVRALSCAYAAGIIDALDDLSELQGLLRPIVRGEAAQTVELDLDDVEPFALPPGGGAVDVVIKRSGVPLARVPATRNAEQWDSHDFVERAASMTQRSAATGALLGSMTSRPTSPDGARARRS